MLRLPGIDADKVRLFGKSFCKLISTAHANYEGMMSKDDQPADPNHQVVINLSSDDDDNQVDEEEYENAFDDEDLPLGEKSGYFQPAPELDDLNVPGTHNSSRLNWLTH